MCFGLEMVIGLVGSAVSAAGAMAQAQAQADQANYNAKVAEINAKTARQQGQFEADKMEDEYARARAQQRVAALKSGVDPGQGSAALLIAETDSNSWLDQTTQIWNRETEATGFENKAESFKMEARAAKIGGYFNAASSMIGGLAKGMGGGFKPTIA